MGNFSTGLSRQQIITALTNGLNAATQTDLDTKADMVDLTAEESARASADTRISAAVGSLIDSGNKNVLDIRAAQSQAGTGTLQFTVNADYSITMTGKCGSSSSFFSLPVSFPAGRYTFSGMTEDGGSDSYRLELRTGSAQGQMYVNCDKAAGVAINAVSDFTGYFNIRVGANFDFGSTGKTVYPMICLQTYWYITQNYVPYKP